MAWHDRPRPDSGRIVIGGHGMSTADGRLAVQRVLGYLPQDLGRYLGLSARELLGYVALAQQHSHPPPGARNMGYPAGG